MSCEAAVKNWTKLHNGKVSFEGHIKKYFSKIHSLIYFMVELTVDAMYPYHIHAIFMHV